MLCAYSSSVSETVLEGDRALLRYRDDDPFLTQRLEPRGTINSRYGSLPHESVLGKGAREVVTTTKGRRLGVRLPTLSEYVTLTPRLVTPIYPADANFIVSLLDIHVGQQYRSEEPLQILEAGTGHGALTLHLAKAISGANIRVQKGQHSFVGEERETSFWRRFLRRIRYPSDDRVQPSQLQAGSDRGKRSAVIHTIDVSQKHSEHAKKVVQGFRRGLYAKNVEFHVGNVSDWVNYRLEERRKSGIDTEDVPFLSHVFLDLPSSHRHLQTVASALRTNGNLIALNPSITQITEGVEIVKKRGLPLTLDKVLELGPNMTGGKEWDVRLVKPKKFDLPQDAAALRVERRPTQPVDSAKAPVDVESVSSKCGVEGQVTPSAERIEEVDEDWVVVCRPKVGMRVTGGAFIGVWKKIRVDPRCSVAR